MIRLYASNETDFTHNRYLLKNVISCEINQIENAAFDLILEYPINPDIQEEAIIKAPTPRGEQLFVIESITKTLRGYKAYAIDYISYKLKKNFLIDVRPTDLNCQDSVNYMFNNLVNPVPFTATSDIKGISTGYYIRKNGLEALIGADNSILNRFGGYLKRDGMNIHIADKPVDNGYEIRMGKNLIGVEQSINISDVVTRLYPTAVLSNDTVTTLSEKFIDSPIIEKYSEPHIKEFRVELTDEQKLLPVHEIHELMRTKAKLQFENGLDLPAINYKVDFLQLSQTAEKPKENTGLAKYRHNQLNTSTHDELSLHIHGISFGDPTDILEKMNQLDISDMVSVYVPKLDIYVKARVIKYVYDAVRKKFKSIELGDYKPMERYMIQNIILGFEKGLKTKVAQIDYNGNKIASLINAETTTTLIKADNIKFEGLVTANENFKILLDGSIEGTNAKLSGDITAKKIISVAGVRPDGTTYDGTDYYAEVGIADDLIGLALYDLRYGNRPFVRLVENYINNVQGFSMLDTQGRDIIEYNDGVYILRDSNNRARFYSDSYFTTVQDPNENIRFSVSNENTSLLSASGKYILKVDETGVNIFKDGVFLQGWS